MRKERTARRFRRRSTGSLESGELLPLSGGEESRSYCSLTSSSDGRLRSSCSESDESDSEGLESDGLESDGLESEGLESEFHPGGLGLEKEQGVISFQLENEDYPEEVLQPQWLKQNIETGMKDMDLRRREEENSSMMSVRLCSSKCLPPSLCLHPTPSSLRLSPLTTRRKSSLICI